jgi:anaerobic selenocysteine-containing dehydrogenase
MADAVGCPAVRASALVNKGIALADTPDRHDQGIALLEQAIAEAEAGDFGYVLHRALYNLLVHQVDVWPPERSRQVLWRMRETGERTGRGSEAPGWAMHHSEIAVIEGDLEAALAAVRDARGHELVPLEGWIDPLWVDLREAALLLERGHLDQAEALLERHPDPLEPRAVSCDVGWLWAQRLEVAARRGDLPAAQVALDGYRSAAPWRGSVSYTQQTLPTTPYG